MTYEDPRSGRERNLGQDDVGTSTGSWIAGIIVVAAVALGAWYFYDHNRNVADVNRPATNASDSSSTGASSGTAGSTTQPAQDSTGVKGTEGGKMAPAPNAPKQ